MPLISSLCLALALFVPLSAHGKPALGKYSIDTITLRLFDRTTNKIVAFDKAPNPYGIDLDVLVSVKVRGPKSLGGTAPAPFDLALIVDHPKTESDEAGNEASPAHKETLGPLTGLTLPEQGVGYYLFTVPYGCDGPAFSAHLSAGAASADKTIHPVYGCAE